MRAAAGRPATLFWQLVDDGGNVLVPDVGTQVTVTVTAGDGTTVLYAAQVATFNTTDKAWEWSLPPQARLDSLQAHWTATVVGVVYAEYIQVDIVQNRLASPWLMRNQDPDIDAIASAPMGKQALGILIDQIEEGIRDIIGYPPVLEGFRVTWDDLRGTLNDALYVSGTVNGLPYGWGAGRMIVPGIRRICAPPGATSPIYAGTINGVALDPVNDIPKLLVENGVLAWADYRPWISGRYSLWGTYGDPNPDGDLRRVARRLCHHFAQTVDFPDRAYSIVTEGAQIMFSMPAPDRPTGLPEVDAVLARKRVENVI